MESADAGTVAVEALWVEMGLNGVWGDCAWVFGLSVAVSRAVRRKGPNAQTTHN